MTLDLPEQTNNRLAIYLPTLVGGGAERVMLNLAAEFVKHGYPVDFVLAQREGAFMAEFPPEVNLIVLNPKPVRFGRAIATLPDLARYLRRARPAALLTGLHANIIAIWAKHLAGVSTRVVISEHNTLSQHQKEQTWVYRHLSAWLIRWFYPLADEIIAVSRGVADDLSSAARLPRERITVVANPIITSEMRAKALEPLDHPWFQPGQPPVLLAIGRMTVQKDFPLLIQSFADVLRARPARLMILGDGPDREKLTALVKKLGLEDAVSMPGFIHNPYPYMVHAAAFVLSSQWEGLPTVLVEALYCETPLVSTDCPSGPSEILRDGQYGKLVPVGNQAALSQAILATLTGPSLPSPQESWLPYEANYVVDQYLKILFGKPL